VSEEDWGSDRPSAQAVEKALNEVYDVVCEGRIVGRIMLTNVPAPYWSWTLAYSFHEGRTPTRGHWHAVAWFMTLVIQRAEHRDMQAIHTS